MFSPIESSVFLRDGGMIVPTELARGPWSADAQHGGAPAGLLAMLAERTVDESGWFLARITMELLRPVPLAPLSVTVEPGRGRSVRRVGLMLWHDDRPVARAAALLVRQTAIELPPAKREIRLPPPEACPGPVRIPGMPEHASFHYTAMATRLAGGSVTAPGPAAAWFRLTVPLLDDLPNTPVVRAITSADFGNGISWVLPLDRFAFANTDLTVYLHRAPHGEWIGLESETIVESTGLGLTHSVLYDAQGKIGVAQQNLLIRRNGAV